MDAAAYTDDPLLQLAMAWNYNRLDVGAPDETAMTHTRTQGRPARCG